MEGDKSSEILAIIESLPDDIIMDVISDIIGVLCPGCKDATHQRLSDGISSANPPDSSMPVEAALEAHDDNEDSEHIAKKPRIGSGDDPGALMTPRTTPQRVGPKVFLDMSDNPVEDFDFEDPHSSVSEMDEQSVEIAIPGKDSEKEVIEIGSSDDSQNEGETSSFAADTRSSKRKRPATKEIDEILKQRPYEELSRKTYKTISKNIQSVGERMARRLGTAEGKAMLEELCLNLKVYDLRYQRATEKKTLIRKVNSIKPPHPATKEENFGRYNGPAEKRVPWSPELITELPNGGLFMRVVDNKSQARIPPDASAGLLSGGSEDDLTTDEGRRKACRHYNKGNRLATTMISFMTDWDDFERWAIEASLKRQKYPSKKTTIIHIVNGWAAAKAGHVVQSARKMIADYQPTLPTSIDSDWFRSEWVILFRAPPEAIVGSWCYTEVEEYMKMNGNCSPKKWYKNVALPAFQRHEAARKAGLPPPSNGCICCGHQ